MTEEKKIETALKQSYARWQQLYANGGSDPFYEDGVNMNLERNNIIYYRKKLEELHYFPEIYNEKVTHEMDNRYMARADEIRKNAAKAFTVYQKNADYRFLLENGSMVTEDTRRHINYGAVIGYVVGLQQAINMDDLVSMRRHEHPEKYIAAFVSCRKRLEEKLQGQGEYVTEKGGQLAFAL